MNNADTFDSLVHGSVSEEFHASGNRPTLSHSWARLEDTVRKEIASILALGEDAVVRLIGGVERESEPNLGTVVILVIGTIIRQLVAKPFQGFAFQIVTKTTV